MWSSPQMLEKEAGKVSVHPFVSADELVGESEAWHESTFLDPKYRGE